MIELLLNVDNNCWNFDVEKVEIQLLRIATISNSSGLSTKFETLIEKSYETGVKGGHKIVDRYVKIKVPEDLSDNVKGDRIQIHYIVKVCCIMDISYLDEDFDDLDNIKNPEVESYINIYKKKMSLVIPQVQNKKHCISKTNRLILIIKQIF